MKKLLLISFPIFIAIILVTRGGSGRSPVANRVALAMELSLRGQQVEAPLQARLEGVTDPAEAGRITAELARRGIARLHLYQLKERTELLLHLDSVATPEQCAARFMGSLTPADFNQMLSNLTDEQLERWTRLSAYAVGQELIYERRNRIPTPTDQEVADAFATLASHVPESERARFNTLLAAPASASIPDRCWLARAINKASLATPSPYHAFVLTTLARIEAGV
jgi:hypothetical protein